jgi:hypothetical protein
MRFSSYFAITTYFFSAAASEQGLLMLFSLFVGMLLLLTRELELPGA